MASTGLTDWLRRGTHAARPASPPVGTLGLAIYFETDTNNYFGWTGSAWTQINGGGGGGGVTSVTTTGSITLAAVGSTYSSIGLAGSFQMFQAGAFVLINDGTNFIAGKILSGAGTATISVESYWQSATSGTLTTAAAVGFNGTYPGITTTTASVTIPAPGATVSVPVVDGSAYPNGSWVLLAGSTHAMGGLVTAGGGTATLTVQCRLIPLGAVGNNIAAGTLVIPWGPVQSPPAIVQPAGGASSSTASLAIAFPNLVQTTSQILLYVWNNTAQTVTTPTGYTLLGAQSDGTVRISVYGKASPAGTTADNPTVALSGSGVVFALAIEVANGGTPTGYAAANQSSVAQFASPTVAALRNDLIIAAFLSHVATTIIPVNISPIWEFLFQNAVTSAGAAGTMLSMIAAVDGNVTAAQMYSAAQSGVGVIIRIPSAA